MPRLPQGISSKSPLPSFTDLNLLLSVVFPLPQSCAFLSCFPTLFQYLLPWPSISHHLRWVMWFLYSPICQLVEAYASESPSCVAVCQSWLEPFPVVFRCSLSLLSLVGKEIQRCVNPSAIIPLHIWSAHIYRYILLWGFGCLSFFSPCISTGFL